MARIQKTLTGALASPLAAVMEARLFSQSELVVKDARSSLQTSLGQASEDLKEEDDRRGLLRARPTRQLRMEALLTEKSGTASSSLMIQSQGVQDQQLPLQHALAEGTEAGWEIQKRRRRRRDKSGSSHGSGDNAGDPKHDSESGSSSGGRTRAKAINEDGSADEHREVKMKR